jgi:uncharacterized protein YuzB (UPF0349 family)
MPACVEYCLANVGPAVRRSLRASDHDTNEQRCLQRCGQCRRDPFLVVDGEFETGSTHADLLHYLDISHE